MSALEFIMGEESGSHRVLDHTRPAYLVLRSKGIAARVTWSRGRAGKTVSSLPFLSVSGLSSGPVARALLPSPGCLQMATQLYVDRVDCVYRSLCVRMSGLVS